MGGRDGDPESWRPPTAPADRDRGGKRGEVPAWARGGGGGGGNGGGNGGDIVKRDNRFVVEGRFTTRHYKATPAPTHVIFF